jgi:hypothetical protein
MYLSLEDQKSSMLEASQLFLSVIWLLALLVVLNSMHRDTWQTNIRRAGHTSLREIKKISGYYVNKLLV